MHTDQADDFQDAVREGRIHQEPDGCMVIDDPPAGAQISTPAVAAWAALLQKAKDRANRAEQERDAARQERDAAIGYQLTCRSPMKVFINPTGRVSAELQEIINSWAKANDLDPAKVISSSGVTVDLIDRVIHCEVHAEPGESGAVFGVGRWSVCRRRVTVPLLVDPPDAMRRPPVGYAFPPQATPTGPAAYDWERYRRTCDPGLQLDGLGDLCVFLGGTWAEDANPGSGSFIAGLLKLIVRADPGRLSRLEAGFPREVLAWRTWMGMSPTPTAAQLAAALGGGDHTT